MPQHPRVYLDFKFGTRAGGRVVFELFTDTTPKTAENFRALCTGEHPFPNLGSGAGGKKKLEFLDSKIFRVRPGFMCQGGDITMNNGDGGESIYGGAFRDENFARRHHAAGCLSMANRGRNSNTSQFFITFKKSPQLDGKHVVFGHVVEGMEVIRAMEKIPTDRNDRPRVDIVVVGAGELTENAAGKVEQGFANTTARGEERKEINKEYQEKMKELLNSASGQERGTGALNKRGNENSAKLAMKVLDGSIGLPGAADAEEKEQSIEEPAQAVFQTERERKLFELKLKMNAGRRANNSAVVEEKKKDEDPNYKPRQAGEKKAAVQETAATRLVPDGREYLLQTAEVSEMRESKRRKKEETKQGSFGWDSFNGASLARAHDKRVAALNFHDGEYAKQRAGMGDSDFYLENPSIAGHVPTSAGKERLAAAIQGIKQKRGEFSRRRTNYDDEDVTWIDERNKVFNKKIERVYGDVTLEMRQNLERGTAL